jgi:hypothetical protein
VKNIETKLNREGTKAQTVARFFSFFFLRAGASNNLAAVGG